MELSLLYKLFVAHLLSDFFFQPYKWAKNKDTLGWKTKYFYYHILVTSLTLLVVLGSFSYWRIILILTVFHLIIDFTKTLFKEINVKIFIWDQILHFVSIVVVWLFNTGQEESFIIWIKSIVENQNLWIIIAGYLFLSIPASILIGKLTEKWQSEIAENGLKDAGKWIGIMERILIFSFILLDKFGTIGFLLAAKSVFRFGDLKDTNDQKKTEYIIIGTFLSFMIATLFGVAVKLIASGITIK